MKRVVSGAVSGAVFASLSIACSGDGLTGIAPAQAVIAGRFDITDQTDCSIGGTILDRGKFQERPEVVKDGTAGEGGVNRIACRVVDAGNDTFRVDGSFKIDDRVLFAVKGTFPAAHDVNGFKADSVTLSNGRPGAEFAAFTQADGQCQVRYMSDAQGALSGRVWGEVSCAKATKDPMSASGAGTCVTITQFRFENCALE